MAAGIILGDEGGNDLLLASISEPLTDLKRIQTPHSILRDLGPILQAEKTLQLVGQAAEFKLKPKFKPLPVKKIERLDCCKIKGRAFGVTLANSLGWLH